MPMPASSAGFAPEQTQPHSVLTTLKKERERRRRRKMLGSQGFLFWSQVNQECFLNCNIPHRSAVQSPKLLRQRVCRAHIWFFSGFGRWLGACVHISPPPPFPGCPPLPFTWPERVLYRNGVSMQCFLWTQGLAYPPWESRYLGRLQNKHRGCIHNQALWNV